MRVEGNSIVIAVTLLIGFLIFFLPRRLAVVPFLFLTILIPINARLMIAELDLYTFRILILFGLIRLIVRREYRSVDLNVIDRTMLYWGVAMLVSYTLLFHTFGAFVNRLGMMVNSLGSFFFFRCMVRDLSDIERSIKTLAVLSTIIASAFLLESSTGLNPFAVFGGVSEFSNIRTGNLRFQGPFGHAISLGTFGAVVFPLFVSLQWMDNRNRRWMIVGSVGAMLLAILSSSSGPMIAAGAGLVGLLMWPLHGQMRLIRRVTVLCLVGLHIVMEAPVWALIQRVKVYSASSGYHRFFLVDQFINRFSEWWLIGTASYSQWFRFSSDVSNRFVRSGVDGGLVTLILLVAIIVVCFKMVGRAISKAKNDVNQQKFLWALGAALFVHVVSFMNFSYWDQIILVWSLLLAFIATVGNLQNGVVSRVGNSRRDLGGTSQAVMELA